MATKRGRNTLHHGRVMYGDNLPPGIVSGEDGEERGGRGGGEGRGVRIGRDEEGGRREGVRIAREERGEGGRGEEGGDRRQEGGERGEGGGGRGREEDSNRSGEPQYGNQELRLESEQSHSRHSCPPSVRYGLLPALTASG